MIRTTTCKVKRTQHTDPFAVSDFRFFSFRSGFFFLSAFSFPLLLPAAATYCSEYVLRLKESEREWWERKRLLCCAWGEESFAFKTQRGPVCGCVEYEWRGMVEVKAEFYRFFLTLFCFLSLFLFFRYYVYVFFCELFAPFFMLKQSSF